MEFDFDDLDGWGDVARPARREPIIYPVTTEAAQRILAPDWGSLADACKARFLAHCAVCNGTIKLQAHHRTYERLWNEIPEDLTCLCDTCHEHYHRTRRIAAHGRRRRAA
jgi:hypothetical protein